MAFGLPQPAHFPVNNIRAGFQPVPQNHIMPQPTPFSLANNNARAEAVVQDNIYVANFNFRAIKQDDLPFFKDDRLERLDFTEVSIGVNWA
jgi:FAD synthase